VIKVINRMINRSTALISMASLFSRYPISSPPANSFDFAIKNIVRNKLDRCDCQLFMLTVDSSRPVLLEHLEPLVLLQLLLFLLLRLLLWLWLAPMTMKTGI